MAVAYNYSNVAVPNTIGNAGGISNSGTSLFCPSTPTGYPGSFPFKLRLEPRTANEEIVKVTAGAGTSGSPWTIVRGWDSTTAVAHSSGAVEHGLTAEDLALSRTHENQGQSSPPHGLPASAWNSPAFAVIQEVTLANSTTPSVTFTSIPQTYAHLVVVVYGRCTDGSSVQDDLACTVNGDSGSNYGGFTIDVSNTAGTLNGPSASQYSANGSWKWFMIIPGSSAGNVVNAGGGWAIIPGYTGTAFNKNFVSLSSWGNATNVSGGLRIRSGQYWPGSQAAITSLAISCPSGFFRASSFVGLYGLGA